jgi:hypothetical protein
LDYTIHWPELRSVDFTAAAEDNFSMLAGDASSVAKLLSKFASVVCAWSSEFSRRPESKSQLLRCASRKQLCGTQSFATFSAGSQVATSLGFMLRFSGC